MEEEWKKEKIIAILREVMSGSENRDWGREAHATKRELEILRNNNYNDFSQIADLILELLASQKQEIRKYAYDWAEKMWEMNAFNPDKWEGEDEVYASIVSYLEGKHKQLT